MINDELQKEFIEFVIGEFGKLGKLFYEKNRQYATTDQVYGSKQDITTPKVDESLRDIAVYSAIMLFMHKKYMEDELGDGND